MVIKMHGGMDMKKKWLAALLSAAMLVTASPVAAMAQNAPGFVCGDRSRCSFIGFVCRTDRAGDFGRKQRGSGR